MSDPSAVAFAGIAATLFLAELTDKDALLLLTLATRTRASRVFLAGAAAFLFTTAVIVTIGAIAITVVPIWWVKLAGGVVMVAYGVWEARGLVGRKAVEDQEGRIESAGGGLRSFLLMAGALAFLDLAGDATEVLTIVFVAQYSDALLVFAAAYAGLLAATAVETALGNRLGRLLTPGRLRYLSVSVFLLLGALILVSSL
jgi:putative Ca2+/H+ antiporter (TMEM165/GDT1 family)